MLFAPKSKTKPKRTILRAKNLPKRGRSAAIEFKSTNDRTKRKRFLLALKKCSAPAKLHEYRVCGIFRIVSQQALEKKLKNLLTCGEILILV